MVSPISSPFSGGGSSVDDLFSGKDEEPAEIRRIRQLVQGPPPRASKNAELTFTYGDVIRAQNEDGDRFEIRMDRKKGPEFAKDFDRPDADLRLRQGGADSAAFRTETFQFDLESYDAAKTLYTLFQAAEGNVTIREVNDNPVFSKLELLDRKTALQFLGIDSARPFTINGVKFRLDGENFTMLSRTEGEAPSAEESRIRSQQDAVRARLAASVSTGTLDTKVLLDQREDLLRANKYAYFDLANLTYAGTDKFADVIANGTLFADSIFFSLSVGYEVVEAARAPQGLRQELAMHIADHVSNDVFSTVLALPPSKKETLEAKIDATIQAYADKFDITTNFESALKTNLDNALENLDAAYERARAVNDPAKTRAALGASFANGVYTVPKFTIF
ncbi:MAG: hypothetical protein HY719_12800 [Planctomycetes bacterium]|nr:hypothetical protein [Planctomycetota bacterium]